LLPIDTRMVTMAINIEEADSNAAPGE